mgnify:CR=1 FL=1
MIDKCDLHLELKLLRRLIKESTSPALSKSLIEAAAKITREIDRQDILRSKYLHSSAVSRLVSQVLTILVEEMSILPDDIRNQIIDAVYARIQLQATNTNSEVRQITSDRK